MKMMILFAMIIVLLIGCDNSIQDYEIAKKKDTIESYTDFLKNHSKSEHAVRVRNRLAYLYQVDVILQKIKNDDILVKTGSRLSTKRNRRIISDDLPASEKKRLYTWAELLRRVFKIDVLECPSCKGRRKLIAFITDPPVIRAILKCLDLPSDPPVLAPARWPP